MRDEITISTAFQYSHGVGNKPLTIKHVLPCFLMLVLGIVISMIIFFLEATKYSFNKKKTSIKTIHVDSEARTTLSGITKHKDMNDTIMEMADVAETGDGSAIATDNDDTIMVISEIQESINDE